jgi:hypothetical protein
MLRMRKWRNYLIIGLVAVGLMIAAPMAMAADKMPVGPVKPAVASGHFAAGTINDAIYCVKTGAKKTGPFAVVTAPLAFVPQFFYRLGTSLGNAGTVWNSDNYAPDVQDAKVAKDVMGAMPSL